MTTKQIVRTGNTYFFYSKKEASAFATEHRLYLMKDHQVSDTTLGTLCGVWCKVLDMWTVTLFSTKSTMMELLQNNK